MSNLDNLFSKLYVAGLFGVFSIFSFSGNDSSFALIMFPILYIYSIIKFNFNEFFNQDRKIFNLFIYVFSGLLLTTIFSYNFFASLVSVIFLSCNFIFAVWLTKTHTWNQFLLVILDVLKYILIISIILLIIKPGIVIYYDPLDRDSLLGLPNIKGLFPHKIHASIYLVVGYILANFFYKKTKHRKYLILKTAFFLGVLATGSSLGFSVLIFSLLIPYLLKFQIKTFGIQGLTFLFLVVILFLGFSYYLQLPKYFLTAIGRDVTLTGRVPIWEFGIDYIEQHPFVGGGFKTFFDDVPNSPAQKLWSETSYYKAPSFHNGFIEILAETGLTGSLPFFFILFKTIKKSLQIEDYISFSILAVCVFANFAAAILIKQNMFFFVFLFFTTIKFMAHNKRVKKNRNTLQFFDQKHIHN